MSDLTLTLSESKALSDCNPKQQSILYKMLETVPNHLSREDMSMFSLEQTGDYGSISLHMRVVSDNGLLSDRIHLIVNKNGKIKLADTEVGDYSEEYDTVSKMKTMIEYYIEDMGSWMD